MKKFLSVFLYLSINVLSAVLVVDYEEVHTNNKITISTEEELSLNDKSYHKPQGSVDCHAKKLTMKNMSLLATLVTLTAASSISLTNCTAKDILSVDGESITLKNCIINSLVVSNYGRTIIKLLGTTEISGDIQFLGDSGTVYVGPHVVIRGAIKNGRKVIQSHL